MGFRFTFRFGSTPWLQEILTTSQRRCSRIFFRKLVTQNVMISKGAEAMQMFLQGTTSWNKCGTATVMRVQGLMQINYFLS